MASGVYSMAQLCCPATPVKTTEVQVSIQRPVLAGIPDITSITSALLSHTSQQCAGQLMVSTAYPTSSTTIITARYKSTACAEAIRGALMASPDAVLFFNGTLLVPKGSFVTISSTYSSITAACKGRCNGQGGRGVTGQCT